MSLCRRAVLAPWLLAAALGSCTAGAGSEVVDGDAQADVLSPDVVDATPELPLCAPPAAAPDPVALGLPIQAPVLHHLACSDDPTGVSGLEADTPDVNWVCTFDHAGTFGVLYLPARPVDCHWDLGTAVDYETPGATLVACGQSLPLGDPRYDWGGNHHNDFLQFELAGRRYQAFHSSFDYKWRQCQPPDCLKVYDPASDALLENGCTRERSLPVTCVKVKNDGTVPPLVDTFARCEGDG